MEKNWQTTKYFNNYSADHKLDDCKIKLTILIVNWFEIGADHKWSADRTLGNTGLGLNDIIKRLPL
jgi:hypothetical protein